MCKCRLLKEEEEKKRSAILLYRMHLSVTQTSLLEQALRYMKAYIAGNLDALVEHRRAYYSTGVWIGRGISSGLD